MTFTISLSKNSFPTRLNLVCPVTERISLDHHEGWVLYHTWVWWLKEIAHGGPVSISMSNWFHLPRERERTEDRGKTVTLGIQKVALAVHILVLLQYYVAKGGL